MPLTKTTTRAFAASLAMVAAGGTIAGAAVFHLPILGLGRADVASANASPAVKRAAPVARKKVRAKVIVKTRYADEIVHVPTTSGAPPAAATAPAFAAPASQPSSTDPVGVVAEPDETTTLPSPATTVAEHDDEGEDEHEHEHEEADEPDEVEHAHDASDDSVEQP